MDFATILFLLPLRFAPAGESVSRPLNDFVQSDPADSATTLLGLLSTVSGPERNAALLLLAEDLAEMGLQDSSTSLLLPLSLSPSPFAPAAFVALTRLRLETGEEESLFREAKLAPWDRLNDEDFAESLYRVGRACLRTNRFPEAREWLAQVPSDSAFYPYSRYLLAQAEYALGRYARAVEAAQPIFSSRFPESFIEPLRERAAVLLAEMFIEIGLYETADQLLTSASTEGPFRTRAARDRMLARGLARLSAAREGAEAENAHEIVSRASRSLEDIEREIESATGSPDALSTRAEELKRAWPSTKVRSERRRWTARRAADALEEARGWGIRRLFRLVWQAFPPAILYRLASRAIEPAPPPPASLRAEGRFFFAPNAEVGKVLVAIALLSVPEGERNCAAQAARALRSRVAAALLGRRSAPTTADLSTLATACGEGGIEGLAAEADEALRSAISAEALRRRRELRARLLAIDEAVAEASLDRARAIHGARMGQ